MKQQHGFSMVIILIIIGVILAALAVYNFLPKDSFQNNSSNQSTEKTEYNIKNPEDKKALYLKYKDRLKEDLHLSEEQFQTLVENVENQQ